VPHPIHRSQHRPDGNGKRFRCTLTGPSYRGAGMAGDVPFGVAMNFRLRRRCLLVLGLLFATTLAGCVSWITYGDGDLSGHVVVVWNRQDKFIYVPDNTDLFSFKPSFMKTRIVPGMMFTDGGSIPRVFWSVPGLSPWAFGPAYIIHDWIFVVHRCHWDAPPEVAAITFEQSAQILAEVGKSLIRSGLIDDNRLEEIVWAIQTKYARDIWDRPPSGDDCAHPPATSAKALLAGQGKKVVDFVIPPPRGS
jgi:hypothetical protein